jgi:hypothetical protein
MAGEETFASTTDNQRQWCTLRRPRIDETFIMKVVNIMKLKYMSNKSLLSLLAHLASRTDLESWGKPSRQSSVTVGFGLETDRFWIRGGR